jgi:hypothetical protein
MRRNRVRALSDGTAGFDLINSAQCRGALFAV